MTEFTSDHHIDQPSLMCGLVVVIEDEAIIRLSLQAALEVWGLSVIPAACAREALERVCSRRRPDLIVADYRLRHGETGTAAIRAIQRRCGYAVASVLVTGDMSAAPAIEARQHGIDLLRKPILPEDLRPFALAACAQQRAPRSLASVGW